MCPESGDGFFFSVVIFFLIRDSQMVFISAELPVPNMCADFVVLFNYLSTEVQGLKMTTLE